MFYIMHFINNGGHQEFVYIAEGESERDEVIQDYTTSGYRLSETVAVDDAALGSFPIGRELSP